MVLDGDLEIVEIILLEKGSLPYGGLDKSLRCGSSVLLEQTRIQRTSVHANAQGSPMVRGRLADLLDLIIEPSDVSGVDAHRAAARLNSGEHILRVEVDIGDHRNT